MLIIGIGKYGTRMIVLDKKDNWFCLIRQLDNKPALCPDMKFDNVKTKQ